MEYFDGMEFKVKIANKYGITPTLFKMLDSTYDGVGRLTRRELEVTFESN
ncbi:hypothetical protein [Pediococcus pentosaceus]|nr:hypothetical protein [Pediococcus pentosaceus]MBF7134325.1 hypothetical protein [Pediococcus pentosaceus]QPT36270.1 hypothetical protein I6G30_08285 [Pediococcus pentosaceus]